MIKTPFFLRLWLRFKTKPFCCLPLNVLLDGMTRFTNSGSATSQNLHALNFIILSKQDKVQKARMSRARKSIRGISPGGKGGRLSPLTSLSSGFIHLSASRVIEFGKAAWGFNYPMNC